MNHTRIVRIWLQEGLRVPQKQPSAAVFGSTTIPAFDWGRANPITFGRMIS